MRKTILNLQGDKELVTLPEPHYTAEPRGLENLAGEWTTGFYACPRTGRKFIQTFSDWDNMHGGIVGTRIKELTKSEYLHQCQLAKTTPID